MDIFELFQKLRERVVKAQEDLQYRGLMAPDYDALISSIVEALSKVFIFDDSGHAVLVEQTLQQVFSKVGLRKADLIFFMAARSLLIRWNDNRTALPDGRAEYRTDAYVMRLSIYLEHINNVLAEITTNQTT